MTASTPTARAFDELRARVRGPVIEPGHASYDEACKLWNGTIAKRPAVVVRCTGTADVMAAVSYARANNLRLAVRGGGHNVSGNALCDAGLVADLSGMRAVHVDPARRRVRAQGGARLGDLDHETQPFGLAVPVGVVSATGVGGLSLHGGMGFLTRKFGLTCDNLVAADVVTADGRLLRADESENPDLLWALRGGGGSFGVVTSFEFQAHPVGPEVWMMVVMYPMADAAKVLQRFQTLMASAPDELMAIGILWSAPHEEFIPEAQRGAPVAVLAGCWCGPLDQGERILEPFRTIATPVADLSGRMPFLDAQKLFDPEYPNGRRYYWKSLFMNRLDGEAIAFLIEQTAKRPSPISSVDVWALGGAMSRVDASHSAFFQRQQPFLLGVEANWDDPKMDARNITWAREIIQGAAKYSGGGSYYNFPGNLEEGETLLAQSFGSNYERLRRVKAKYDPENLFQENIRIPALA